MVDAARRPSYKAAGPGVVRRARPDGSRHGAPGFDPLLAGPPRRASGMAPRATTGTGRRAVRRTRWDVGAGRRLLEPRAAEAAPHAHHVGLHGQRAGRLAGLLRG